MPGGGAGDPVAGRIMNISLLEIFADALKAKFSLPGSASPEDQLKPVVADLLKSAGTAYGLAVNTRTETHLSDHKVRPDIAVYVGGLIGGYIELKAPGLGADAPKLKGEHNKKQWEKLTCIVQPGALRFEKIQVDRYVVVLLLSAGHASASPVVDQRWDLHLFVG
jgi:hypothetical protein